MTPHFERLGELAGDRLDELAQIADKHPPVLQPRDRFGRDEDWIDYHPAYREMEKIAFDEFGMHAMSHRAGVLGMNEPAPSAGEIRHHLSLRAGRVRPDVPGLGVGHLQLHHQALRLGGAEEAAARPAAEPGPGDHAEGHAVHDREGRRLGRRRDRDRGRARSVSAPTASSAGSCMARNGSAAMPMPMSRCCWRGRAARRRARRGSACSPCRGGSRTARRNSYRIVRLKDKLGTRSMASGEIILDGATAYLVGDVEARLQADDGAGQPVAPQPRRARRVDDAALPQRGAGRGARPPRLRPGDRASIRCCAAS